MTLVDLIGKLPVHPTLKYAERPLGSIRWLVLHHAAGPEDQTPEQIARFHVGKGWPGIAYQYVIGPDGTAYKCWPTSIRTYCVENGNTASLCVCLIGNRQVMPVPTAQWLTVVELFRDLSEALPGRAVVGHREVPTSPPQSTACPGRYIDLDAFRAAVNLTPGEG